KYTSRSPDCASISEPAGSDTGLCSSAEPKPREAIASNENNAAAITEADRKICDDMQAKLSMHSIRPQGRIIFQGILPATRPLKIIFQDEPGMKMAALLRPSCLAS